MEASIDEAADSMRGAIWTWFAIPGGITMLLLGIGLVIGSMAVASRNSGQASCGSVILGISAIFTIIGALSAVTSGIAFTVGGHFLSDAIATAANDGNTLTCNDGSAEEALCSCLDDLTDFVKGLGAAGFISAVIFVYASVVAIGGSSSLQSMSGELRSATLIEPSQIESIQVGQTMGNAQVAQVAQPVNGNVQIAVATPVDQAVYPKP